ncbi:MAG: hypothetical protein PVF17_00050 [Ignavibacteria bacterium]|jgi:large-conductance mechanosensitive channel
MDNNTTISINLDQTLADLITSSISTTDQAKEFITSQTPEIIQQTLLWYGFYNFILVIASFVILFLSIFISYKIYKKITKDFDDGKSWTRYNSRYNSNLTSDIYDFIKVSTILLPIIGIPIFISMVNIEWLKIWIAPKLWLIEFASNLVK